MSIFKFRFIIEKVPLKVCLSCDVNYVNLICILKT